MQKEYPYIPPPYYLSVPTIRPDTCRLRIGSNNGPLSLRTQRYINRPLKWAIFAYYPCLPLISHKKQHAEPLNSPEIMGPCLEATERLKNWLAHVVFYTLNEQKTVSNKGVEVKASKGVRVVGKEGNNAY